MSIFWPRRREPTAAAAQRSTSVWPAMPYNWASLYSGQGSYVDVNVSTVETSLQSVAVRSAVDLIASLGSELPAHVYSGQGSERRQRPMPGYLQDPSGEEQGLADWCYQALESWLLRGNLYGDILEVSSSGGFPTQVLLQHPDRISPYLGPDGYVQWMCDGKKIDKERMLHRRVNPVPGQVLGLSPIGLHANQIGLNLTANRFGLQWFRDGAHPGGMLTNTETDLGPEVAKVAKDRFMAALRGTREPVVLGKGWTYKQVQVNPAESQFLETQGYSAAECARIFGPGVAELLGYESGGSLTYANVESRSAHLLVYTVNRWLRRLERLLTSMLPRPQYMVIDRDGLLQSTTLDRYKAHESALKNRWKTVNEVRVDEDMPPVDWGDQPNTATGPAGPAAGAAGEPDTAPDTKEDGA